MRLSDIHQVPHGGPAVGAVPGLLHGLQLGDDGLHLGGLEGGADHDCRSTRPGGEHGDDLG
jgi:hypothetical protein